MSDAARRSIVAVVAHARDVDAADRSTFADAIAAAPAAGLVRLVTCHRVEVYGLAGPGMDALLAVRPPGSTVLRESAAARHVTAVAVGRDSAVLGEDEILHQVRSAFDRARAAGRLDAGLTTLFSGAVRAGRLARSWHHGRRRSLGDVAVEAIRERAGSDSPPPGRILVVGAGTMGAIAARSVRAAGLGLVVANRDPERASRLAATLGGTVAPFDPGRRVAEVDGVIVAIGGAWRVAPSTASTLVAGSAVVVDLSFPPAVGALARRLGPRFIGVDELAGDRAPAATRADASTAATLDRLDRLTDETVDAFDRWRSRDGSRAAAAELVRRAEAERARELDELWRRIPSADPETRAAVDDMTRHFAKRLLRPPLERLHADPDDGAAAAVRELFAL
jgi:glutamyl-tRNA reductase